MNKLIFVPESRYDEMRTAEANYKTMAEINKGLEAENERLRAQLAAALSESDPLVDDEDLELEEVVKYLRVCTDTILVLAET